MWSMDYHAVQRGMLPEPRREISSTDLVPIRLPMKSTDPNSKGDAVYVGVDNQLVRMYIQTMTRLPQWTAL